MRALLNDSDMGREDSEWEARRTEYDTLLADIRERRSIHVKRMRPPPRPDAMGQLPPEAADSDQGTATQAVGPSRAQPTQAAGPSRGQPF